jgi:peptide/nickel transport system ATP-binding protein
LLDGPNGVPRQGALAMSTNGREALIELRDLEKHFPLRKGIIFQKQVGAVRAVDGVTLDVVEGETLGLVGESGSGKSTTARLITRLLEPTGGSIVYHGKDIAHLGRAELKPMRRDMQMIFQDPYSSLNPRKTVGTIIGEPFIIHKLERDEERRKKLVQELMDTVGLNPEHYNRFPHEFSGGQRQRIGVARAIALKPKLLIADEPVSALDVSIQAQIINLLAELRRELGLTMIFIAHDLSVVRHVCDRVAVMYLGKIVEIADADQLFEHPRHPYTGALLSAVPVPDPRMARNKQRQVLGGDVPSPTNPPVACRFHTRCPKAQDGKCNVDEPQLEIKEGGNIAACHFPLTDEEIARRVPTAAA